MRNKWIYTIFVLVLGLFASCSDTIDEAGTGGKSRKVVFRLSVNDTNVGSRAAWGDSYDSEDGNPFEKTIKGDSLRVAIFSTENVMLGEVQNLLHWATDEDGNEYEFVGDFSHVTGLTPGAYKIMVLANASSTDVTAWNNMQFDFKQLAIPTGSVPMWGVHQVDLTLEEMQNIGTIDVLRAAAKVEVALSSEMAEKYTLESVFIDKVRGGGYFFPTGWDKVTATTGIDQTLGFRSGNAALLGNTFFKLNKDKNSAVIYLPEYNNVAFDPASITLSVKEKNSDLFSAMVYPNAIPFCQYGEDGKPINNTGYNIVRNHYYRYTITNIKGDGLELVYLVADWEDGGTFEHTFDYPTYHNPVVDKGYFDSNLTEAQRKSYTITTVPRMVYSSDNTSSQSIPFTCWFKIDGPEGKTAKPSLEGSPNDYFLEVYKNDQLITEGLCTADANNWYEIRVIPKTALENGTNERIVKLGIVYHQQWMPTDSHIHLYINGDENNIAWPDSGSDPQHIEIKQVRQTTTTNP